MGSVYPGVVLLRRVMGKDKKKEGERKDFTQTKIFQLKYPQQ